MGTNAKNSEVRGRGPVVHLSRIEKARMIEAVLSDYIASEVAGLSILDIGCGNGDISNYFQQRNHQYAVDIVDQRKAENHTFDFTRVDSELIPFEDQFFDVVISHHVIEHVDDQKLHLKEIYRVLKPDGVAYLATPNKSSPVMEGHVGNDQVLEWHAMRPFFEQQQFEVEEYSCKLLQDPAKFYAEIRYARLIPLFVLKLLRRLFPSHVFMLRKLPK